MMNQTLNDSNMTETTTGPVSEQQQQQQTSSNLDESCVTPQLEKYLAKLIELVPDLKEIDREEKIRRILFSTATTTTTSANESLDDGFQNLDLNAVNNVANGKISDLQILQSVLDYIRDLQSKVDLDSSYQ